MSLAWMIYEEHRLSEADGGRSNKKEIRFQQQYCSDCTCREYEGEKRLLTVLEGYEEVDRAIGLANTEAIGGYAYRRIDPRQFSELMDLDYEMAASLHRIRYW